MMQLKDNFIGDNKEIKAFQETFGEEVEDKGEKSYNTGDQGDPELAERKIKVKLESKELQPNMQLKDESENMSELAQQTEEKYM